MTRRREHVDPYRAAMTKRMTIRMPFIHEEDLDWGGERVLFVEPDSPLWLRNIAVEMGQ